MAFSVQHRVESLHNITRHTQGFWFFSIALHTKEYVSSLVLLSKTYHIILCHRKPFDPNPALPLRPQQPPHPPQPNPLNPPPTQERHATPTSTPTPPHHFTPRSTSKVLRHPLPLPSTNTQVRRDQLPKKVHRQPLHICRKVGKGSVEINL
jgi:hypothetical protein